MALWDNMPSSVAAESIKCPGCAGNLIFDAALGKMICHSCGNFYETETLNFVGNAASRDTGVADEQESNKIEYVCDGCGSTIVTDKNTAATFCSFCGSPTLIGRRLVYEFRPDYIIPFKVTKEQAIKNIEEWIKTNKYCPNDIKKHFNLQKITGLYVPFWLIDADCTAELIGSGMVDAEGGYMNFAVSREIEFHMSKVPFDGAKHIDNLLMKALEPFDYSEMVSYNDMYLPGFYAERYDENFFDITERAALRIDNYARELGKFVTLSEYKRTNFGKTYSTSTNYSQLYALLPVWFLRYEYEGTYYTFGVNGQTGEAGGSVPFSEKKRNFRIALEALKWSLPGLIVLLLGGAFIGWSLMHRVDIEGLTYLIVLWGLFLGALASYMIWSIKRVAFFATNPLDAPPPIETYIDTRSSFKMKNNDRLVGFVKGDMPEQEVENPSFFAYVRQVYKYFIKE